MTKLFLVKFEADCNDEFNVYGVGVMTEKQKNDYFDAFKAHFKNSGTFYYSVGTNESIDFDDFKDFERAFTIKEIDSNQSKTLVSLGLAWYGHFPDADDAEKEEEDDFLNY